MTLADRITKALAAAVAGAASDAFWYAAGAGLLWLVFYVLFRTRLRGRKVIPRVPTRRQMGAEVARSLRSIAMFGVVSAVVVFAALGGHTRLYGRIEAYGWWWYFASIGIAVVLHDTYFYWTHRLMHHPRLFARLHRTHHLSANPTPWAAYSFSTAEAFVQAGIGPLVVFLVPMHGTAFLLFMIWQITFNVFGHCGYEIFPRWFLSTWAGRFLNTPTHHALHHEAVRGNYGLYFNVWDRLMGTNHPHYHARFVRAAGTGTATSEQTPAGAAPPPCPVG